MDEMFLRRMLRHVSINKNIYAMVLVVAMGSDGKIINKS